MATRNSRDVRMTLSVETLGEDDILELKNAVEQLAAKGGDAAPEFQALADQIGRLAAQNEAVSNVRRLSEETEQLRERQEAAAASVADLQKRLDELRQRADQARAAQEGTAQALQQWKDVGTDAAAALTSLIKTTDAAGKKTQEYKDEVARLILEKATAKKGAEELTAQLQKEKAVVAEVVREQAKLEKSVAGASKNADILAARVAESEAAMRKAVDTTAALGVETDDLAKAEGDLLVAFKALKQSANDLDAVHEAARQAGRALDEAFRTVGVRSAESLRAEIGQVRAAMQHLETSGAVTGAELRGAFAAGNARIKELEREIRQVSNALTLADKAASLFKNSMGQIAAGNLVADAIASVVERVKGMGREFITANLEIERLRRTLEVTTGSAEGAAQKIEFLRRVANTAGQSISGITDAFIRFQASASASGIAAEKVDEVFQAVTVNGSKMGMTTDRVALALDALGQMSAKNVVSMEELRQQLGDSLPGAFAIAAKGLDRTSAELAKMVETGQLLASDFFPAFVRGLEMTFGSADQKVEGLMQSFNRLRNAFTELYQEASDSSAFKILAGAMDALAANLRSVVDVVYGLGKAFAALKIVEYVRHMASLGAATKAATTDITAQTTATTANTAATAANTTATAANTAAKEANAKAAAAQGVASQAAAAATTATVGAFNILTGAFAAATKAGRALFALVGGLPGLFVAVALNAKELGTWLGETAAKWMGYGKAIEDAERKMAQQAAAEQQRRKAREDAIAAQDRALQKEILGLENSRRAAEARAEAAKKATQADEVRATNIEKLVGLYGTESEKAQAAADATNVRIQAAQKEAEAKRLVVEATEKELAKREELMAQQEQVSEKFKEETAALADKIAKQKEEAAEAENTLRSLQLEGVARELSVAAISGQRKSLEELRAERDAARRTLGAVTQMEQQGLNVAEAKAVAELNLAKVSGLYRQELEKNAKAIQLDAQVKSADLQVTLASTKAQQSYYERLAESARAQGDNAKATYYTIEAKKLEIKQIELSIQIKEIELKAEQDVLEAQKDALRQAGELTSEKEKELNLRIQLVKAKQIENEATKEHLAVLNKELENLRLYGNVQGKITQDTDRNTNSRNKNADAIRNQADATRELTEEEERRRRLNVDEEGFSLNTRGERISQMVPTERHVYDSAKEQGLTDKQALQLVQRFWRNGSPIFDPGKARQGENWWSQVASAISETYMANARLAAVRRSSGGPDAGASTMSNRDSSTNKTVTINVGGRSQKINVNSDADVNNLTSILRQLETQANTAS